MTDELADHHARREREKPVIRERLEKIHHILLVLSGKGGVGKSTFAVNLAFAIARQGRKAGLLDVDVHGPSVPKLLGIENRKPRRKEHGLLPVELGPVSVMSIGFLLPEKDNPVIWRGPMKHNIIRQFIMEVDWGELDYLVIDSPPGTGDEPLSVVQLVPDADGAVILTTPQELAVVDVRKCISFCRTLNMPVLGVVENMSGFVCPHCGNVSEIFRSGGGESMAREMAVPFLGRIPLDPGIAVASDSGTPYLASTADTPAAHAFSTVVDNLLASLSA